MKPRVLFVSRRVNTPLSESERRKWDAVREEESWEAIGYTPLLASRVVKARREGESFAP